jgi:predicted DCC family thiol-disulfide oxidoreductase YuxK
MVTSEKIILFDGLCNLCSGTVLFVLKRDPKAKFKYASLQSNAGQAILKKFNLPTDDLETFVYVCDDKYYRRSTAALRVFKELSGLWPILFVFIIVPAFLRDLVYRLIAKTRYKLFGKKTSCMMPNDQIKNRFIE